MTQLDFSRPCQSQGQHALLARLTRHLKARLEDFGPGGPTVLCADQSQGFVRVQFPGHCTNTVLTQLAQEYGVSAALENYQGVFYLTPKITFEDLDYVWGCLFNIL